MMCVQFEDTSHQIRFYIFWLISCHFWCSLGYFKEVPQAIA